MSAGISPEFATAEDGAGPGWALRIRPIPGSHYRTVPAVQGFMPVRGMERRLTRPKDPKTTGAPGRKKPRPPIGGGRGLA
jgi:hypothetical protein